MGEFSWTKADVHRTKSANIMHEKPFKCLIPAAYGGGYIKSTYDGCGKFKKADVEYDMFELVAFWNHEMPLTEDIISRASLMGIKPRDTDKTIGDMLRYEGEFTGMKEADANTLRNRRIGILIGTYDDEVDELAYPLKLTSASYGDTYEACEARSYTDPNQGCIKLSWQEYDNCKVRYRQLHLNI